MQVIKRIFMVVAVAATVIPSLSWADPQVVETVVVTGRKNLDAVLCDYEGNCIRDNRVPVPDIVPVGSGDKSPADKLKDFAKKVKNACRSSNESCEAWGQRMIAPVVLDSNGIPTGQGMGYCVSSMTLVSVCAITIMDLTSSPQFCAAIKCPEA